MQLHKVPEPELQAFSDGMAVKTFVDQINAVWRRGAGDFIACGNLLVEAKTELQRDVYNTMLKKLHFDASVAKKLICIANKSLLGAHVHLLPPSWSTIYELSKLTDKVLRDGLADGMIHPGMQRKDAVALRKPDARPVKPANTAESETLFAHWQRCSDEEVTETLDRITPEKFKERMSSEFSRRLHDSMPAKLFGKLVEMEATDIAIRILEMVSPKKAQLISKALQTQLRQKRKPGGKTAASPAPAAKAYLRAVKGVDACGKPIFA